MASSDDLAAMLLSEFAEQIVGLPLAHDLQMGIRLVKKQVVPGLAST